MLINQHSHLLNQQSHVTGSYLRCFKLPFHPPTSLATMRSLTATQTKHILSLLDSGHSAHQISSSTGLHTSTISRLCSKHRSSLQKSLGGCPPKLNPANTRHAIHLISPGRLRMLSRSPKHSGTSPTSLCLLRQFVVTCPRLG